MSREPIDLELTVLERGVLSRGCDEWNGTARGNDAIARAFGFESASSLLVDGRRLSRSVSQGLPLTRSDWTRALLSLEVLFASDVIGAGVEWSTITGFTDGETITALRGIQRKLGGVVIRPDYREDLDDSAE
ncbi:hypothetical protein [Frondihabitans sp. 762G35]|uniref:hypothetical protein n=1 Tax=Frondihabitans sp. 762G35 TaxID=1446794 RepID=UPI000F5119D9|nr:hypothetical protein [Frondihabitans sp. 762G35]